MIDDWRTLAEVTGVDETLFEQMYEEERRAAMAYVASVTSDDDLPQFMLDNQYSFAATAEYVSYEQIDDCKRVVEPRFQAVRPRVRWERGR